MTAAARRNRGTSHALPAAETPAAIRGRPMRSCNRNSSAAGHGSACLPSRITPFHPRNTTQRTSPRRPAAGVAIAVGYHRDRVAGRVACSAPPVLQMAPRARGRFSAARVRAHPAETNLRRVPASQEKTRQGRRVHGRHRRVRSRSVHETPPGPFPEVGILAAGNLAPGGRALVAGSRRHGVLRCPIHGSFHRLSMTYRLSSGRVSMPPSMRAGPRA